MSDERTSGLHLPSLSITGFRGIDRLSIGRLGRVTLLAGRNGVGKTTVLDAVRVYAAKGRPSVLNDILDKCEEVMAGFDEDRDPVALPDYAALFHGRVATPQTPIVIGPTDRKDNLRIEMTMPADWTARQKSLFAELSEDPDIQVAKIVYRKKEKLLPWFLAVNEQRSRWASRHYARHLQHSFFDEGEWPVTECEALGPGLPGGSKLSRLWDKVALTQAEDLALEALRLILDGRIDRVAVVGNDEPGYRRDGRRVVAKLQGHSRPVPLKSLGDGVTRMFAAGLALANSRDGFLVVDEAENGLHHSVQRDFWRLVLRAAHENNVQVLATTHSLDCVKGFGRAATESSDAEGVVVRLERDEDGVRAVEYTEEELETVAEQDIEVR